MNIQSLETLLKEVKEEKTKAMKPYNKRIKNIQAAIRNLNSFNAASEEINETLKEDKVVQISLFDESNNE